MFYNAVYFVTFCLLLCIPISFFKVVNVSKKEFAPIRDEKTVLTNLPPLNVYVFPLGEVKKKYVCLG